MNNPPDLEKILEVICVNIKSAEDKAIVETYFRNRDALTPEYREKAVIKIKEVLSGYPEFEGLTVVKKYGATEEKLEALRKKLGLKLDYTESMEEIMSAILKVDDINACNEENPMEDTDKRNSLKVRMRNTFDKYTHENEEIDKEGIKENLETVIFRGKELCRADHEVLQDITKTYSGYKTAEDYFKGPYEVYIEDKRVKSLIMDKRNFKKIPEQIQKITQLRSLRLRNNQISRIENLEQLRTLQSLDLSYNQISKIENLEQLRTLQSLDLSYNQISKIENLEQQKELMLLNLSHNQISKIENLEQQKQVSGLDLRDNSISKIENLEMLERLVMLHLDGNQISKIENLEKLKQLNTAVLLNNKISILTKMKIRAQQMIGYNNRLLV